VWRGRSTGPGDIVAADLSRGGYFCCRPAPGQISNTVSLGMFFVHSSCRDGAGVARAVSAALIAKDECDRSVEHKEPRIELVRVSGAVHVWLDCTFPKLIALTSNVGFKFGSIHRHPPFARRGTIPYQLYDDLTDR
jgi:hypothetical protein